MGFKVGGEGSGKGMRFFNINGKEGIFIESVKNRETGKYDRVHAPSGSVLTGYLDSLKIVTEKNPDNEDVMKARAKFASVDANDPAMSVEVVLWRQAAGQTNPEIGEASAFGLGWLATLNGSNLDKPMAIMPWAMKKGDKMADGEVRTNDSAGISIRQDGEKVKKAYVENGKVTDKLAPLPSQVFAGKTMYDKSGWNDVITNTFMAVHNRLHPADTAADNQPDADDSINPAEAAQAAERGQPERARA